MSKSISKNKKFTNVAFTGTEIGATWLQRKQLDRILTLLNPRKFTHGSCVGSDHQAHKIAVRHNLTIEIFPCDLAHMQVKLKAAIIHPNGHWIVIAILSRRATFY
jgi:hypothetical protein